MNALEQMVPLPELWNGFIDKSTFSQFMDDLRQHARALRVRIKFDSMHMTSDSEVNLTTAQKHLIDGSAHSIQVRYLFDGQAWCDTLLRTPCGIQLLRIRREFVWPAGGEG